MDAANANSESVLANFFTTLLNKKPGAPPPAGSPQPSSAGDHDMMMQKYGEILTLTIGIPTNLLLRGQLLRKSCAKDSHA